jgi:hypothetical protein
MSDSIRQSQRAGDHSRNLQAQTINITGISVSEARQIALDVFKANALELAGTARDLFEARGREFIDRYLEGLLQRKPDALTSFGDPDMLHVLFTAQRDYAKRGDQELSDLLVDLLIDRAQQHALSLRQLVLNESLFVAPKLTSDQFDILSLAFIFRHSMNAGIGTLEEFDEYFRSAVIPFAGHLPDHSAPYQHLQYAGCAMLVPDRIGLLGALYEHYPHLFCNGFTHDEAAAFVRAALPQGGFLIPCLRDSSRLQVCEIRLEDIQQRADQLKASPSVLIALINLHKSHMMPQSEIEQYLSERFPTAPELLRVCKVTEIERLSLTSVGIAIAHANIRRKIGQEVDLGIWIK